MVLSGLVALHACSSGGGGEAFAVESVEVPPDAVWRINRPIAITFSQPVDPTSISLNTINVREVGGAPATGEFHLAAPNVVVFQPRCPLLADLSDAGLQPGGVDYELRILGALLDGPSTVRSASGAALAVGDVRHFETPLSTEPAQLFFDAVLGPPRPIVRSASPSDMAGEACYVEIGADPDARVYFRLDATGVGELDPPGQLPPNRLSDVDSHVALVLHFDQAVDPAPENVGPQNLAWQFDAAPAGAPPQWEDLAVEVELVANCTQSGATVRVQPLGGLPPDTALRVVVAPQFRDLVGESALLAASDFALAATGPKPSPPSDEWLEAFADASGIDASQGFAEPPAAVVDGKLAAAFSFDGTGGIHGTFDWRVPAGQTLIFDTDAQVISGGPNFVPLYTVSVIGGVLDVRDLRIEAGGTLKVQGTQPMRILASRRIEILGTLDIRGADSQGIVVLDTTDVPEQGAVGVAGGGRGGTSSPLASTSSPRGGNGFGAFDSPDGGGEGGETGWTNANKLPDSRRGAGGGGGRFGRDQAQTGAPALGTWDQAFIGLDAEVGFTNVNQFANGATSGLAGPLGGAVGPAPFSDSDPANDFFGNATVAGTLVRGELATPWAGAGGGAGGDAAYVAVGGFPATPFDKAGDEKGGPGGGGGGALHVQCLGDIVFGANGRILCRGGSGGGGENSSGTNRVGGGGGGGSGGHVVLETAGVIDLSLVLGESTDPLALGTMLGGILATGGQGGAGRSDLGGATLEQNGKQDTQPRNDACPPALDGDDYPTSGDNACRGHIDGAGGDGGPGLVQLHTPAGLASVLLPAGKTLADVCKPAPLFADGSGQLAPSFGRLSRAQSNWVPLGRGGFVKSDGSDQPIRFALAGIDPGSGRVLGDGAGGVLLQPALKPAETLVAPPGLPAIVGTRSVALSAIGIDPEFGYALAHPEQLTGFCLRLVGGGEHRYDVVAADYDADSGVLTVHTDPADAPIEGSFAPGAAVSLHPTWFRVYADGIADALPASAAIELRVQAAAADPATGLPDPESATPFVSDAELLNAAAGNDAFRYLRYQVLFDLTATGGPLTADAVVPALDFLRLPFRFD